MRWSAAIITANVAALSMKHGATPAAAIIRPASAGPTIRAQWTITLLRLTALTSRPDPTISMTNACRVGLSTAFTDPRAKTSAKTIQGSIAPAAVRPQSPSAGTAITAWVSISRRRLS
jgi:hypothetical protein